MAKTPLTDVYALHLRGRHLYKKLHSTEEALIRKATTRRRVMRPFHAEVQDRPGLRIVRLTGELDAGDVESLRESVSGPAESTVWLDLSGLTFMDRRSIGTILNAKRRCHLGGHRFIVTGATGVVRRLFELLGLRDLLLEGEAICPC